MSDFHTSFTGPRLGMTTPQRNTLTDFLKRMRGWLHHGDCLGSDEQMHLTAFSLPQWRGGANIAIHPPVNPTHRAYCTGEIVHDPEAYLVRNHTMVDVTGMLIGTPATVWEMHRSGTWATIRYARQLQRPIVLILPDGSVRSERIVEGMGVSWQLGTS